MALNILFYEMKIHKPTEQDLKSLNLAISLIIFTLYAIQLGSMIKLNVQKLNPIFFYSNDNTIFNNNNEYKNSTIKVDQFWRNGEWNIFIWKNIEIFTMNTSVFRVTLHHHSNLDFYVHSNMSFDLFENRWFHIFHISSANHDDIYYNQILFAELYLFCVET